MKRLLILPAVLVLGAWGPCRPSHNPPATTTTTVAEQPCVDPATIVHVDQHDDVFVHYADGPNGPHPVGWNNGAGCVHPY